MVKELQWALPIWGLFMKSCYKDKNLNVSNSEFEMPNHLSININCDNPKNSNKEDSRFGNDEDLDF